MLEFPFQDAQPGSVTGILGKDRLDVSSQQLQIHGPTVLLECLIHWTASSRILFP